MNKYFSNFKKIINSMPIEQNKLEEMIKNFPNSNVKVKILLGIIIIIR